MTMFFQSTRRLSLCLVFLAAVACLGIPVPSFGASADVVKLLTARSLKDHEQGVELLAEDESPESASENTALLSAMLEGDLYYVKKSKKLVIIGEKGKDIEIFDPATGESLGMVKKRAVKRISTNNSIRKRIRGILATHDLSSPDVDVRRAAAAGILDRLDQTDVEVLEKRLAKEKDTGVLEILETAMTVKSLDTLTGKEAADAIKSLKGNLNPAVLQALASLKKRTDNPELIKAIADTVRGIEAKAGFFSFLETLFFGASLGSVLVLAAIGLAITFGVMGVINMAHGELIMLGAYTTYVVQQLMPNHIDISLFVAVPAAFIVAGLMGIVIERCVIRFLYGRPLETLLATFGVSLILQQAVRSIFSPLNRSVSTPSWMSGSIQVNPIFALTMNRMYIILFCLMAFAALFMVLKKTRLGLEVRAVSQNRAMARAMGTRAALVDALTFGLGSGIAGIAGVALSQLTNVGPNLGQAYIIDSFMVVVFGGVGNLWGTLVAGLSLGVVNKVLEPLSGAVLAKILVLVFIILFIQKRPTGLFPQKGRAVEE